ALDVPAFVTVMVKSTLAPTATEPLLAIFATPTSAREVSVVTSDAESLPVLTSPPPETEAVLVSGLDADWPTAMVTVIAGYVALALSASDRVQVTSWAATPQRRLRPPRCSTRRCHCCRRQRSASPRQRSTRPAVGPSPGRRSR